MYLLTVSRCVLKYFLGSREDAFPLRENNHELGFPGGTSGKESACQCRRYAREVSSISGSKKFFGGGGGNPLQYSCLENFMDKQTWRVTVHGGRKESDTTERAGAHTHTRAHTAINLVVICCDRTEQILATKAVPCQGYVS